MRAAGPRRRAAVAAAALVLAGLVLPGAASADTAPPAGTPATVSADVLPTWQVNGVVWSQVLVGNTVYATGNFTRARPPGVALGGAGEIAAAHLFAYDIRTGNRVAGFAHALNGQGRVITRSPDGSRVYLGGDFTTVDGVAMGHVAAFSTATGALDRSFRVSTSGAVRALAASPTTLYLGGSFGSVNGRARTALAAVRTDGVLLPWAPRTGNGQPRSMVLAPDRSRVIVGGTFTTLNGQAARGMGSLSAATGAVLPWAANKVIHVSGPYAGITSLRTDGRQIYGSAFQFGMPTENNFEGTFAANPLTGALTVVNNCHGDTYDVLPVGPVLYSVGHAYSCRWIGSFPDTTPRVRYQRALAQTVAPTRKNAGPDEYGWNYAGLPASTVLHWFPQMAAGTFTGQKQAGWSVTGNGSYIAMGGEFPTVNGTPQQGLVRMAIRAYAPDKRGPTYTVVPAKPVPATTATPLGGGKIRVDFGAAWDLDNATLTYQVRRDGTTFIATRTVQSSFWKLPRISVVDSGLPPGSRHFYQVKITDPLGNVRWSPKSALVTA